MKGFILLLTTVASCLVIEANEQWSQFRGHYGNGIIKSTSAPINWSENTNIDWKTPIHDRGWSSPVIWNDQIWMTTATKDGNKMKNLFDIIDEELVIIFVLKEMCAIR